MKNVLSQNAFWIVNKQLAKKVGLEAAMLLSDLVTKMEYFVANDLLTDEGFFFNTAESIESDTTLTYHKQKNAISVLEKNGFIETKLIGIPAKLHFKIFESQISNFLNTGFRKNPNLINKNKDNKNKRIRINPKNEKRELIFPFNSDSFIKKWELWKEYKRVEHKFRYKSIISEQSALKKLSNISRGNEDVAVAILEDAMSNGYKGFFELNTNKNKNNETTTEESGLNALRKLQNERRKIADY